MRAIVAFCSSLARKKWRFFLLFGSLSLLALLLHPVDALVIRQEPNAAAREVSSQEPPLFQASAGLGQEFSTQYTHSVQLTPVQDSYRIVDGYIWSWQGRVQSHNAGLPFAKPAFGRFRMAPPWMILEGGRQSWKSIALRVGDAELGRNLFAYGGEDAPRIALHEIFPGKLLRLSVERHPLIALLHPPQFTE